MMKIWRGIAVVCAMSGIGAGVACSGGAGDENVGSQGALLVSYTTTNYPVSGTFYGRHETASAYVEGDLPGGPAGHHVGGWLTTWNGNGGRSYAYSLDANGVNWVANEVSNANAISWGDPGPGQCDNSYLTAWQGDPWVAPDYNPATNNNSARVFFTNIGQTALTSQEGALIARSDDGGQTWGGVAWVDDPTSCGNGAPATVDTPVIASNPQPPYDTWVAWDRLNDPSGKQGRLQRVWYDAPPASTFHKQFANALVIPDTFQRHRIAIGKMPSACTTGQEAVFDVAISGFSSARCSSGVRGSVNPQWAINVFDTGGGKFLLKNSSQVIATVTGGPDCLTDLSKVYNVPDPSIAADPLSSDFFVATTTVKNGSNRIRIQTWTISCTHGKAGFRQTNDWTTPDPCDPDPTTGQCTYGVLPDGGIAIQDEWQPVVGYAVHNGLRTVVAYWYGTRDDINNHYASVYSSYSEDGGLNWSSPVAIAVNSGSTQTWDPYNYVGGTPVVVPMWDYNTIGVDALAGRFLAVWGGDNRIGGSDQIESELAY
jgi:hypothetical protein